MEDFDSRKRKASATDVERFCETDVEVFSSTYKWIIHNFSLTIQKTNPKFPNAIQLTSSKFKVDGYDEVRAWYLHAYTQQLSSRTSDDLEDVLALQLRHTGVSESKETASHLVKCTLSILDDRGSKVNTVSSINSITVINEIEPFARFISMQRLGEQKKSMLVGDTLTVECEVKVVAGVTTKGGHRELFKFKKSRHELSTDFEKIMDDPFFGDIVLKVGKRRFYANKAILAARSPVFATMFLTTDVKVGSTIRITDITPLVLEKVLLYMYTDDVPGLVSSASELLEAANKYELKGLQVMCEETICQAVNIENAATVWLLADRHGAEQLKSYVLQFISRRKQEVVATEGYKKLEQVHPNLVIEAFRTA